MGVLLVLIQIVLIVALLLAGLSQLVGAKMQIEAFKHLGLPQWFRVFTGLCLCIGVAGLVIGFWYPVMVAWSSLWLGFIMLMAGLAHLRAKDPIGKSIPAFALAILAVLLLWANANVLPF